MPDYKEIGLSAKDILMGVVTVVAGAEGGQAGAQGAQQLDRGLDGVIGMAGVKREAPPSRLNPERADFAARERAIQPVALQKTAPQTATPSEPVFVESVAEPAAQTRAAPQPAAPAQRQAIPVQVVADLARLGHSDEEIAQIVAGQYRPASAGETRKAAGGQPVVAQVGTAKQSAEPVKGSDFEGFSLGSVLGVLKSLKQS